MPLKEFRLASHRAVNTIKKTLGSKATGYQFDDLVRSVRKETGETATVVRSAIWRLVDRGELEVQGPNLKLKHLKAPKKKAAPPKHKVFSSVTQE